MFQVALRLLNQPGGGLRLAQISVQGYQAFDRLFGGRFELVLAVLQRLRLGQTALGQVAQNARVQLQALLVVLHELRQIQDRLQDAYRDVFGALLVRGDGPLQLVDDLVLVAVVQDSPHAGERDVVELVRERRVHLAYGEAGAQDEVGGVAQQLHRGLAHPLHPVVLGVLGHGVHEDVDHLLRVDLLHEGVVALFGDLGLRREARLHAGLEVVFLQQGLHVVQVAVVEQQVYALLVLVVEDLVAVEHLVDLGQLDQEDVLVLDYEDHEAVHDGLVQLRGVRLVLQAVDHLQQRAHDQREVLHRGLAVVGHAEEEVHDLAADLVVDREDVLHDQLAQGRAPPCAGASPAGPPGRCRSSWPSSPAPCCPRCR